MGALEKLEANQLQDLVRQYSGGFILIEVAVWVAADIKIRYSVNCSSCLGLRREPTVKSFLWRRGYFPCAVLRVFLVKINENLCVGETTISNNICNDDWGLNSRDFVALFTFPCTYWGCRQEPKVVNFKTAFKWFQMLLSNIHPSERSSSAPFQLKTHTVFCSASSQVPATCFPGLTLATPLSD